jgi:hypothetical protein
MNILPPLTVWFVIAGTALSAYAFTRTKWKFHAGDKIIFAIFTIMGLIILRNNHII